MREFFKQCLEDLEPLTGIRQLYFLQTDPDGRRKIEVLLTGMVETSRLFDYIPQEAQQNIIRRMMKEDKQYDSLNARTIHKWLDLFKDKYYTGARISEEEWTPPPPMSEETSRMVSQFVNQLNENFKASTAGKSIRDLEQIIQDTQRKETGRQRFVIHGLEIYAMNQEEAQKAYDATVK